MFELIVMSWVKVAVLVFCLEQLNKVLGFTAKILNNLSKGKKEV